MKPCENLWESLIDNFDGSLDTARQSTLVSHLESGCVVCRERLNWLQEAIPALNTSTFEMPPANTVEAAHNLFREKRRKPSLLAGLAQQIFDSRTLTPQFAGIRGANDGTFRVLYQIEGIEIELYGETTEAQDFYLIGQARSMESTAALTPLAAILTPGKPTSFANQQMAKVEGNEFHFAAISKGVCLLTLWLENVMLSISDIQVGV